MSWAGNESPRVATSSVAGEIHAAFYGFDMDGALKGLLTELLFGNIGVAIPTYVRSNNSTVVHQIDSAGAVTNAKRLNRFLESDREEIEQNDRRIIGYIPGGLNTAGELANAKPSKILRMLLNGNIFQTVAESQKS